MRVIGKFIVTTVHTGHQRGSGHRRKELVSLARPTQGGSLASDCHPLATSCASHLAVNYDNLMSHKSPHSDLAVHGLAGAVYKHGYYAQTQVFYTICAPQICNNEE